jgi:AraC-like DNA-binding protein
MKRRHRPGSELHRPRLAVYPSVSKVYLLVIKIGFNTLSNFNRRFQEIKAMTPCEYRKKFQQNKK